MMNTSVVVAMGRFNPPTIGHERLIDAVRSEAKRLNAKPMVFIVDGFTTGKDRSRNPLTGEERMEILQKIYPDVKFDVIGTASDVVDIVYIMGMRIVSLVAGSDRIERYGKMVSSEFGDVHLYSLYRNDKSPSIESVSATRVRSLIQCGDYEGFRELFPGNDELAKTVYALIRARMVKLE